MPPKTKFIISVAIFVIGAVMAVTPYFTYDHFELLLPGVILVVSSGPLMYYFYAKSKNDYRKMSDEEILRQAEIEAKIPKENDDAKK